MRTLLPTPDAPMMKKTSPSWTSKLTPRRIAFSPKDFLTLTKEITKVVRLSVTVANRGEPRIPFYRMKSPARSALERRFSSSASTPTSSPRDQSGAELREGSEHAEGGGGSGREASRAGLRPPFTSSSASTPTSSPRDQSDAE